MEVIDCTNVNVLNCVDQDDGHICFILLFFIQIFQLKKKKKLPSRDGQKNSNCKKSTELNRN